MGKLKRLKFNHHLSAKLCAGLFASYDSAIYAWMFSREMFKSHEGDTLCLSKLKS